ncbi:GNAT family N-acetyltransferase [Brevundimonas sp. NIBR11]|uniref:GNAT family N-acetyltransferase n=1 Tax=Brevundimonas sp. NIBR11 TaxID=3015999 RepID=UPI0022F03BB3|nr:GNAT family N-acetyltransferase [Brevundimonas sp. NIBR11]WGM32636.1 [Ribosomal protein S18]-alanine N-acetyltransferase [Brevundimonas sp. NIBR11]
MNTTAEPDALAQGLAELHAESFHTPWSAVAFADLLGQAGVVLEGDNDGLILIRVVADEAEILTLAVRPSARRQGLGGRLVEAASRRAAELGANRMFLEVAEDNAPARALYGSLAFKTAGRRPRYYPRADGPAVDALILVRNFA